MAGRVPPARPDVAVTARASVKKDMGSDGATAGAEVMGAEVMGREGSMMGEVVEVGLAIKENGGDDERKIWAEDESGG